jgi:hypothetical protein
MSCSTRRTVIREDLQEARERVDRLGRLLDREPLRRLVEQQHARLLRHRHGDFEQALVAVREQSGRPVGDAGQAELLERRIGVRLGLLEDPGSPERLPAPWVAGLGSQPGILARRHLGKKRGDLEGARDAEPANPVTGRPAIAGRRTGSNPALGRPCR